MQSVDVAVSPNRFMKTKPVLEPPTLILRKVNFKQRPGKCEEIAKKPSRGQDARPLFQPVTVTRILSAAAERVVQPAVGGTGRLGEN